MIKIREESDGGGKRVVVMLESKDEKVFDTYPITIRSKEIKSSVYEIQKKAIDLKDLKPHDEGLLDKVKEKALEVKDSVVDKVEDTTKGNSKEK